MPDTEIKAASAKPVTNADEEPKAAPAPLLAVIDTAADPFAGPGPDSADAGKPPLVVTAVRTDDASPPKQISDHVVPEPLESQEARVSVWIAETRYLMSTLTADFTGPVGEIFAHLKTHL